MITLLNYRDPRPDPAEGKLIDVTSKSPDFSGLSPFNLGPVKLWGGYTAKTVENAWQYSKVYGIHDEFGKPTVDWYAWAAKGWAQSNAVRYPMGKGEQALYSWWENENLDYVSARARIYFPLYAKSARRSPEFRRLQKLAERYDLFLLDFDTYNYREDNMRLLDVVVSPERCGHALVLALMLEFGEDFYLK